MPKLTQIEESAEARVNVGVSVIVRVTLKDGTFHEVWKKRIYSSIDCIANQVIFVRCE